MKTLTGLLVFLLILLSVFSLGIAYKYRAYQTFKPDKSFFESAINQKLEQGYKQVSIGRESFFVFMNRGVYRTYKLTLLNTPLTERWKPQPRKGFEAGETLEWERIVAHSGRGLTSIAKIKKGSNSIVVYVYTQ